METPNYYSILPANVRYDSRLKANEKLLYSEITALSNKSGSCYASNRYFAELYNVSNKTISLWIKNLKECKYITVQMIYKDGSKEVDKRNINIINYPMEENSTTPPRNLPHPPPKKVKDNNIIIPPSESVVNYIDICLKDTLWIEAFCMTTKTNPYTIEQYLIKFNRHLIQVSKTHPNIKEFKNHFNNWINRQGKIAKMYKPAPTDLRYI